MNLSTLKPYQPERDPLTGYVTRDGRKVRILATDLTGGLPIVVAVGSDDDVCVVRLNDKGKILAAEDYSLDLMCVPIQHTVWLNTYTDKIGEEFSHGTAFWSRKTADELAQAGRVACVPVTFTEGEGL